MYDMIQNDAMALRMCKKTLGDRFFLAPSGYVALHNGGPALAIIYHNYRNIKDGAEVEITISSNRTQWFGNMGEMLGLLRMIFFIAFYGASRVMTHVHDSDAHILRLCHALGFIKEGTMRKAGLNGDDVHIFGMLKSECPWIGED